MSLVAFLMQAAHAGPTIGLGVGGIGVLPANRQDMSEAETSCEAFEGWGISHSDQKVREGEAGEGFTGNAGCGTLSGKAGGYGGQVVVPLRFRLTDTAALRLSGTLGMGVMPNGSYTKYTMEDGSFQWAEDGEEFRYQGGTSVSTSLRLMVGPEIALRAEGVTPYFGAGVGAAVHLTYSNLGHNVDDFQGWQSGLPLTYRTEDAFCKLDGGSPGTSCLDIWSITLAPAAEAHIGVMNRGEGLPFFAEVAYAPQLVAGHKVHEWDAPREEPATGTVKAEILDYLYRPLSLSVGLNFQL